MRFLLITRSRIYKRFINRRSGKDFYSFRAVLRYGLEAIPLHGRQRFLPLSRTTVKMPPFYPGGIHPVPNNW